MSAREYPSGLKRPTAWSALLHPRRTAARLAHAETSLDTRIQEVVSHKEANESLRRRLGMVHDKIAHLEARVRDSDEELETVTERLVAVMAASPSAPLSATHERVDSGDESLPRFEAREYRTHGEQGYRIVVWDKVRLAFAPYPSRTIAEAVAQVLNDDPRETRSIRWYALNLGDSVIGFAIYDSEGVRVKPRYQAGIVSRNDKLIPPANVVYDSVSGVYTYVGSRGVTILAALAFNDGADVPGDLRWTALAEGRTFTPYDAEEDS